MRPVAAGALTVALTAAASLRCFLPLSLVLPLRDPPPISRFVPRFETQLESLTIPSLAPSWWSPCPLLRWAFLSLYGYVLGVPSAFSLHRSHLSISFAISPCLRCQYQSFAGGCSCGGTSPHALGSVGAPGGSRWLHLYRLTPDLVSLRDFAMRHLELRSVFHAFPARRSACIHGDKFVSFTDLYVSHPQQSYRVVIFGRLK